MKSVQQMLDEDMKQSFRKAIDNAFKEEWFNYQRLDYYARRLYGKYTIYNKDGAIVAKGLSREQMQNYMKLLQEEE